MSDPELLMEAMEMREALAEARDAGAIAKVAAHMNSERKATLVSLSKAFAGDDRDAARAATLRLKYLTKLDDEIRGFVL